MVEGLSEASVHPFLLVFWQVGGHSSAFMDRAALDEGK
jgi:hypothetical protein